VSDDQDGAVPPRGWGSPRSDSGPHDDMEALAALLAQLLSAVPEELRSRLTEAARALLQALRALLDWLASLLGRGEEHAPVEVRDIPIL
jgi:hypothetical protein